MELLEAINGRRSVRDYTDETVSDTVLQELIGLAVQAPSALNPFRAKRRIFVGSTPQAADPRQTERPDRRGRFGYRL